MRLRLPLVLLAAGLAVGSSSTVSADPEQGKGAWQRDAGSLAWTMGSDVVWRFSFDEKFGKPFFDPVRPVGGPSLTNFKPEDHPWHYGLWFSWKYVNGANYWEENRTTGKAEGITRWFTPTIVTAADGSARITMNLTYTHPSDRVDMTETRTLAVSAPGADGGYTIDWQSVFTAGTEGAVLDRTPMPGEPKGAVNGGYAGLGVRLPSAPLVMSVVSPEGPVTNFVNDRARPSTRAVGISFADGTTTVASLAILSDPANIGEQAPWYLINSAEMRFADPAILAPAVKTLKAGERWTLRYRLVVSKAAWTPDALAKAITAWR
jgi:hypothetical protein